MLHKLIRLLLIAALVLSWMSGTLDRSLARSPAQLDGQTYIVQRGDSLTRISARFYGDARLWPVIVEATNQRAQDDSSFATITTPSLIYPGQKLWIPHSPAPQQPMQPTPQPTAPPPPTATPPSSTDAGQRDEAAATTTPGEEDVEVVRLLLFSEEGALVSAQEQMQLALTHLGFLQNELEQENLESARRHAEHVINILEGEEGILFGDNDRDGQIQNPGDGVGVRGHLAEAQGQSQALLASAEETDTAPQESELPLVAAIEGGQSLAQEASERMLRIFAVDTVEEGQPVAEEVAETLGNLQSAIDDAITSAEIFVSGNESIGLTAEDLLSLRTLVSADAASPGTLVQAESQIQLAMEHLGFLQNELEDDDLDGAWRHAEHVINILEGEEGILFGDNDRDGQIQNPGDGVGVRGHLAEAQEQIEALLAVLAEREDTAEAQEAVEQMLATVERSQALVRNATRRTFQIFAADTTGEAKPMAEDVAEMLSELHDAVDGATTAGTTLLATLEEPAALAEEILVALQALLADEGPVSGASSQTQLALDHLGFLQSELARNNLRSARRHAEHVINILEGEAGIFFGDNDRDGQIQNPGDGIGVRGHIIQAATETGAILTALEEAVADGEIQPSVQQMVTSIQSMQDRVEEAVLKVTQAFAADTAGETRVIAADAKEMLVELQEIIDDVVAIGGQLLQP
jgi:hypothetical protein